MECPHLPWRHGRSLRLYRIQAIAQKQILLDSVSENRFRRGSWLALKNIVTI